MNTAGPILFLIGTLLYLAYGYPVDDPTRRTVILLLIAVVGYGWAGLQVYLLWSARRKEHRS